MLNQGWFHRNLIQNVFQSSTQKMFVCKMKVSQNKIKKKTRSTIVFKIENKTATTLLHLTALPNGLKGN